MSCIKALTVFSAFNLALWQHLASSISVLMIENLASGAITCRNGSEAIAIGWVSAFVALFNAVSVVMQGQSSLREIGSSYESASGLVLERQVDADAGHQGDDGIELEEPQRQRSWQQTQIPNFALLQAMMFISGMADRETIAKRRSTTAWVNQMEQMRPGFAETIVETEGY